METTEFHPKPKTLDATRDYIPRDYIEATRGSHSHIPYSQPASYAFMSQCSTTLTGGIMEPSCKLYTPMIAAFGGEKVPSALDFLHAPWLGTAV